MEGLTPHACIWVLWPFPRPFNHTFVCFCVEQRVWGGFSNVRNGNAAGERQWGNPPAGPSSLGLSISASSHSRTHRSPGVRPCSTVHRVIVTSESVVNFTGTKGRLCESIR